MTEQDIDAKIESYIAYAQSKIEMLERYTSKLTNSADVNVSVVKEVLCNRMSVTNMLTIELQRLKKRKDILQRSFTVWWSQKFSEKRKEMNPTTLAATKWASKSDIEAEVIAENSVVYLQKQEEIDAVNTKIEFVRRILTQWNAVQFDLGNLTKIVEIEYHMTGSPGRSSNKRVRDTN